VLALSVAASSLLLLLPLAFSRALKWGLVFFKTVHDEILCSIRER
jgi:hypothetical protein